MSVDAIGSVGTQLQVLYAPAAHTVDAQAAGSTAAQSASQTAQLSAQFASTTSVTAQVESYFGSVEQGGFDQQLLRLIIMLMLLDQVLNGERGSENRLAMLGLALGLAGGAQVSFQSFASFQSVSFSQQTTVTAVSAMGLGNVSAAYGGPESADGDMSMAGGSGQRIDVTG